MLAPPLSLEDKPAEPGAPDGGRCELAGLRANSDGKKELLSGD